MRGMILSRVVQCLPCSKNPPTYAALVVNHKFVINDNAKKRTLQQRGALGFSASFVLLRRKTY
jgi:hypothetical protein